MTTASCQGGLCSLPHGPRLLVRVPDPHHPANPRFVRSRHPNTVGDLAPLTGRLPSADANFRRTLLDLRPRNTAASMTGTGILHRSAGNRTSPGTPAMAGHTASGKGRLMWASLSAEPAPTGPSVSFFAACSLM